jgi:hypothetical protein
VRRGYSDSIVECCLSVKITVHCRIYAAGYCSSQSELFIFIQTVEKEKKTLILFPSPFYPSRQMIRNPFSNQPQCVPCDSFRVPLNALLQSK